MPRQPANIEWFDKTVKMARCSNCSYVWQPRVVHPKFCPFCQAFLVDETNKLPQGVVTS